MTDTATIETLTAEVRTLMVGSRQVTLSVAKQLDEVPLQDITVFGRVRVPTPAHDTHVIGADPHGVLSIARYEVTRRKFYGVIDVTELGDDTVTTCGLPPPREGWYENMAAPSGIRFALSEDSVTICRESKCNHDQSGSWTAEPAVMDKLERELLVAKQRWDLESEMHAAAASSPLIVLAGLK